MLKNFVSKPGQVRKLGRYTPACHDSNNHFYVTGHSTSCYEAQFLPPNERPKKVESQVEKRSCVSVNHKGKLAYLTIIFTLIGLKTE